MSKTNKKRSSKKTEEVIEDVKKTSSIEQIEEPKTVKKRSSKKKKETTKPVHEETTAQELKNEDCVEQVETIKEESTDITNNEVKAKTKKRKKPHIIIYLISILIFTGVLYHGFKDYQLIDSYTFLPDIYLQYFHYGLMGCGIFFGIFALLPLNNLCKILSSILCVALAFALAEVSIILPTYKGRLEKVFIDIPDEGEMNINVYVLKDSQITTIDDLADKTVAIQSQLDLEHQEHALTIINRLLEDHEAEKIEYKDIYATVDALYNHEVDAILLNETYIDIVNENEDYIGFLNDCRVIYTVTQKVNFDYDTNAVGDITTEPFIVMVGGNDTWEYDAIMNPNNCGRNDVNLMAAVNPQTKQILIITIPRDSYINLWGNTDYPDKLTHTTWHGVNCWIETINDMMGVDINYYVRVNFSSLVNVIDALGGIDIDNPYTFESTAIRYYNPETGEETAEYVVFEEGTIHLKGEHALGYVRERYHLRSGDFDRNKHQAIVLRAIVDKITSVDGILHFSDLLEAVQGTFVTDVSMDQIYALAQMQLNDMAKWSIQQYSISGYSTGAPCYSLGIDNGNYSVVIYNQNSVATAQNYIQRLFNGEIITVQ